MKPQTITIKHQTFILHPTGATYWQEKDMLLIADVHLGKVTHFRKHGSAVPQEVIYQNFEQLNAVITHFQPKEICFLGDLFHSYLNSEWYLFVEWVEKKELNMTLIVGNHDIIAPSKYEALGIHVTKTWDIEIFSLTHHPVVKANMFNICGHIHPGIQLQGLGKQSVRVPCFFIRNDQMILPAFGNFTGMHSIKPASQDQIFAITEDEVIKIKLY